MFIYQGKLTWLSLADSETFTIVFPKGVVRVDDPDLKKLPNSDDVTFTLPGARYTFIITTEQNYSKIKVEISDAAGSKNTLDLKRKWQAQGQPAANASLRIWAGKLNWRENAVNEQAIFILPEGYGNDRPVVSSWQWTKDGSGNAKTSAFSGTYLKALGSDNGLAKFSFNNYFDITCAWNVSTEKLAIKLKAEGQEADLGELNLVAKIEPHSHNFDSDDAAPPGKKELEVRLPQPQPTLQHILDPLPLPRTLLETLTHGAAFIDQAGYLAIQAQNRFAILDADFHKQAVLIDALKKDKENLENQVTSLNDALGKANAKIAELKSQLAKAIADHKKAEAELQKKIESLQKHDLKDEALIKELRNDLNAAKAKILELRGELSALQIEKKGLLATIAALQDKILDLRSKKLELENKLKVQEDRNKTLQKENLDLVKALKASQDANKALQKDLARSQEELADTKKTLRTTEDKLKKTEVKLGETEAELKSTKVTLETTQGQLRETTANLEKTTSKLHITTTKLENRDGDLKKAARDATDERTRLNDKINKYIDVVNSLENKCIDNGIDIKEITDEINNI
ncbi:hypothetical protein ACJ41O_001611 [Fusarium nematophilum]